MQRYVYNLKFAHWLSYASITLTSANVKEEIFLIYKQQKCNEMQFTVTGIYENKKKKKKMDDRNSN